MPPTLEHSGRRPFRTRAPNPRYSATDFLANLCVLPKSASRFTKKQMEASCIAEKTKMAENVPLYHFQANSISIDKNGVPLRYHKLAKGPERDIWIACQHRELIKLVQTGAKFVRRNEIPTDKVITYYNPRCTTSAVFDRQRVRGALGGNLIEYLDNVSAATADLVHVKVLLNSVVSEKDAKWMTIDLVDFYLQTLLSSPEYVRITAAQMPYISIKHFNLAGMADADGAFYMEIHQCVYGLPQSGVLAQRELVSLLCGDGFVQDPNVPCLFTHPTMNLQFTLVVDDLGVKYSKWEDVEALMSTLKKKYELHVDKEGTEYLGLGIEFGCEMHYGVPTKVCTLTMPDYVERGLLRFGVSKAVQAKSPVVYVPPDFGSKIDIVKDEEPVVISPEATKRIQQIVGYFLYYARALDSTVLYSVTAIASAQARPTASLLVAVDRLLAYLRSSPPVSVRYWASPMHLIAYSDASYNSAIDARSRAGGYVFLGDMTHPERLNGPIYCMSSLLKLVAASAAEAEYGAAFKVAQDVVPIQAALRCFGYINTVCTLLIDNECAIGFANNTMKLKRSKAIDMRYHWLRQRVAMGQFKLLWVPSADNIADFFTKALPVHRYIACKNLIVASAIGRARWIGQKLRRP